MTCYIFNYPKNILAENRCYTIYEKHSPIFNCSFVNTW